MTEKKELKTYTLRIFPIYVLLYIFLGIIGFIEGTISGGFLVGFLGLILGITGAVLCSLLTITGLIPILGILLYLNLSTFSLSFLGSFGISIGITQIFTLWIFFIFTVFTCVLTTFVSIVLITALIRKGVSEIKKRWKK